MKRVARDWIDGIEAGGKYDCVFSRSFAKKHAPDFAVRWQLADVGITSDELTRKECEGDDAEYEPNCREDQAVTEEQSEIHARDSRAQHSPERRNQISHVIADAQRQQASLRSHADGFRRLDGDKALNQPLPAAGWNEHCDNGADDSGQKRKRVPG